MARRKQKKAAKKSWAPRIANGTLYYRTKFVAYGDLLGRRHRIYVKIALHRDDWCMLVLEMTPLCEFGASVFQGLSRHDVVELYVGGRYLNARVASKGADGTIYIYAEHVLRGLAGSRIGNETQIAKSKKAGRNG